MEIVTTPGITQDELLNELDAMSPSEILALPRTEDYRSVFETFEEMAKFLPDRNKNWHSSFLLPMGQTIIHNSTLEVKEERHEKGSLPLSALIMTTAWHAPHINTYSSNFSLEENNSSPTLSIVHTRDTVWMTSQEMIKIEMLDSRKCA